MFTSEILRNPFQVGLAAMERIIGGSALKLKPHLKLDHPRRVDVGYVGIAAALGPAATSGPTGDWRGGSP
jgi:hypothetical protein